MAHPLARALDGAVHGRFPEPDGRVEVVGRPPDGASVLVCFTAHTIVALDVDVRQVMQRARAGRPIGLDGTGVRAMARAGDRIARAQPGCRVGCVSRRVVTRLPSSSRPKAPRILAFDARRAIVWISETYETPDHSGVVVLGRGVTRRWELAFEVGAGARGRRVGTRMMAAGAPLLPTGTPIWMQVAPANARSLRAAVAAGFRPIGSEILFVGSS